MVNDGARRSIRNVVDISMFIRTRQEDGTIFYLGSSSVISPGEETFILAQLDAGELLVKIQFNGTLEKYTVGGQKLDDGKRHLIQVRSHYLSRDKTFRGVLGRCYSYDCLVTFYTMLYDDFPRHFRGIICIINVNKFLSP